jgi:hypothetical protein
VLVKLRQQVGLVLGVLVEAVDVHADHVVGVEVRQLLADRGFGALQDALHRVVGVDDGALVVRNHHPRRDVVQRNLDPQRFVGLALGLGDFEAHPGLQVSAGPCMALPISSLREMSIFIGVVAARQVPRRQA